MTKQAAMFVDYQQRAKEFAVGDSVSHVSAAAYHLHGRVMAIYPAIGMVDVEWPFGTERLPVEELQRYDDGSPTPPQSDNVPGGAAKVPVPGAPDHSVIRVQASDPAVRRVVDAFVKKALYWAAPDRHYKATALECTDGSYHCPRCKDGSTLRPVSYQRTGGASERLLGCPGCLFLIKRQDIIGHPDYIDDAMGKKAKFARVRMTAGVR